jgi:CubicO group peptidase (beta-lactamase class C family)
MKDTGFSGPPEKASRYAKPLPADPDGGAPQARSPELTRPLNFDCGGGCAASTAGDYLRFASMLLHQGRAGNTRILGRKTVEFMISNQLGPEVKNLIANADPTRAEFGFGLGVAVKTSIGNTRMMGSAGSFGWPGASGTDWWVDPKEDLVVVCMLAAPGPARWHYRQVINALVYQSLID